MNANFILKNNKVYFKDKLLKKITAENFETITYISAIHKTYIKCLKDIQGIWFFSEIKNGFAKFLTTDTGNFTVINDNYAKDSKNVYLVAKDGFKIPDSDANSFVVLRNAPYFSKDKNQLYALDSISGLTIYRYADCNSIVSANGHQFVTDMHNLYHYSFDIKVSNDQKYLNYLDTSLPFDKRKYKSVFEANKKFLTKYYPNQIGWWHKDYPYKIEIKNIIQVGFYKTQNAVFYLESNYHLKHSVPTLVSTANRNSFKELNEYYGIDNKNVFYKSLPILNADLQTFKLITEKLSKDKNSYFYNGNKVACDYESFEVVAKTTVFFKDKNMLFSEQPVREGKTGMRYEICNILKPIKKASPNTIKVFSNVWAIDKNQVYRYGKPFKKADVKTFAYLSVKGRFDWCKDKNHLFNDSVKKIVIGINGSTFKALNKYWGKDLNHVVYFNTERILPSADANTFKITDNKGGAVDEKFIYSIDESGVLKKIKK